MPIYKTLTAAAAMMVCSLAPEPVAAQTPTPAPAAATQAVQPNPLAPRFLGLDVFAGGMGFGTTQQAEDGGADFGGSGWEVGATVRFRPWLGLTSTFGRTSAESGERLYHVLAGPRVSTDIGGEFASRGFAHVLAGWTSAGGAPVSRGGYELVAGVGFDTFAVVRLQFDYVRARSGGDYRNGLRGFFGAVIPLCFRGCRPRTADGFEIR